MRQWFVRPEWYVQIGTYRLPALRTCEVPLRFAPEGWEGVKALFVSDIHLGNYAGREFAEKLVEAIGAVNADLLLLGGDYAETEDTMRDFFERLARVPVPLGKFAVQGNNDVQCARKYQLDLRALLAERGVRLLVNQCETIPIPGGRMFIGGADECHSGNPDVRTMFVGAGEADVRILLSHYPIAHQEGFLGDPPPEVVLSGHTHGGQVNLLGITPYTVGYERLLVPGMQKIKGWHGNMLVSSGIGYSKFPLRVGVRPEMHLIKFRKISGR